MCDCDWDPRFFQPEWPEWLKYDEATDVLTIHGVKYAAELFKSMGMGETGTWLRITERHDGVLSVRTVDDAKERLFTALADLPPGMVRAVVESSPPAAPE